MHNIVVRLYDFIIIIIISKKKHLNVKIFQLCVYKEIEADIIHVGSDLFRD
jgi:hypothetical protein